MNIDSKTDNELLALWQQLFENTDVEVTGASQETFILSLVYTELCRRAYKSEQGVWIKEKSLHYQ